jgi:hypothetical protein
MPRYKTVHQPDEFNAHFAATVATHANELLAQWQAGVNTFAQTALQARREYIECIRNLHIDGLDGAAVPDAAYYLTADVTEILVRPAAPTRGRPMADYRVRLLSGETLDISRELGEHITWEGRNLLHYSDHIHLPGDKRGHAKWRRFRMDGNDFGLLLEVERALA